jgi:hypothetical protein
MKKMKKILYCVADANLVQYLCPTKPKLVLKTSKMLYDTHEWHVKLENPLEWTREVRVSSVESGCMKVPKECGLDEDSFLNADGSDNKKCFRVSLSLV